jgi:hypothetical protein
MSHSIRSCLPLCLALGASLAACAADDPPDPRSEVTGALSPSPNDEAAFRFFLAKGLENFQVAGIIGNLDQESQMNPGAVQGGGPGRGIAQWSVGGRWDTSAGDNLAAFARAQGESMGALQTQLEFVWFELTSFPGYGLAALRASTTLSDATVVFERKYEICAQAALNAYGNLTPAPDPEPTPQWYVLSGDWNGDGIKSPGLYNARTHEWILSNHNSGGGVDFDFGWGGGTQVPVVGDWDGNGTDTPGLYNPVTHVWTLSNHNSGGGVDAQFGWGGGTQVPVVGDWNGDGIDTPGLYNPATHVWTLSNHNSGGGVDAQFGWGGGTQIPVVGDWNGDGVDSPGLYNPATHVWTLSNHNSGGGVDAQFGWGGGDRLPIVGDWDGNGTDTPGLFLGASREFTLTNFNASSGVAADFGWGPVGSYTVAGAP